MYLYTQIYVYIIHISIHTYLYTCIYVYICIFIRSHSEYITYLCYHLLYHMKLSAPVFVVSKKVRK